MSFTLANLMSDTRFLLFNDSSNTTYSDTDLKRNINRWYLTWLDWVTEANGDWQVEGTKAYTDLVSSQRNYALPDDIIKLNEVYIKYDDEYIKATQRDADQIAVELDSDYQPFYPEFDLMDNSIYIYLPVTIPTKTAGLRIHYQSVSTELANNSDTPKITEYFKRILSIGAAYDYCLAVESWNKAKEFSKILGIDQPVIDSGLKKSVKEAYANRSTAKPIQMIPVNRNYR